MYSAKLRNLKQRKLEMAYTHLSLEERHYIEVQGKEGVSQNKISQALGGSQSSISREINRNTGKRGYRHKQAHHKAEKRHKIKAKQIKLTGPVKQQITHKLRED